MKDNLAFYLQKNNNLFQGNVLVIGYNLDEKEMKEYGLTSNTLFAFIKCDLLQKENSNNKINYKEIVKKSFQGKNIFLRIQSECMLGMYGDSHCDCENQRITMIKTIAENGGIYIHVPQEAQGWGLFYKLKELELQVSGRLQDGKFIGAKTRDEAQKLLLNTNKFKDSRSYLLIYNFLKLLELDNENFVLLSNNYDKLKDLENFGLNIKLFAEKENQQISQDNLSEYLIKILNTKHKYNEKTLDTILEQIKNRNYTERTLSTLVAIVNKIKTDAEYDLDVNTKNKILETYNEIICGEEKHYFIEGDKSIKIQNNFCCRVSDYIYKIIKNIYGKNIFDRISFEKLYYFEKKDHKELVKIRTSTILDVRDNNSLFFVGQKHAEQRVINEEKNRIVQSEVTVSRLKSYFENADYNYIKRVEMITTISEYELQGIKIFVKRIPTIENRVLDIFGKSDDIKEFLNKIMEYDNNVLLNKVTDLKYEEENFNDYNLRFADLYGIIEEEKEMFNLLKEEKKEDGI